MIKATREQLEAIATLRRTRDFGLFMEMIGKDFEVMNERLIRANLPNDEMLRVQGQLRYGMQLTDTISNAEVELEKLKQPRT